MDRTVSDGDASSPWAAAAVAGVLILVHLGMSEALRRVRRGATTIPAAPVILEARRRLGLHPARPHSWMVVLPLLLVLFGAAIAAWRLPGLRPPLIAGVVLYLTYAWELLPLVLRLWRAGPRDLVLDTRYETTLLLYAKQGVPRLEQVRPAARVHETLCTALRSSRRRLQPDR